MRCGLWRHVVYVCLYYVLVLIVSGGWYSSCSDTRSLFTRQRKKLSSGISELDIQSDSRRNLHVPNNFPKFFNIVGQDPNDSKSSRLHVDIIFRFCFHSFEEAYSSKYSSQMIGNSRTSTGYSVTDWQFSRDSALNDLRVNFRAYAFQRDPRSKEFIILHAVAVTRCFPTPTQLFINLCLCRLAPSELSGIILVFKDTRSWLFVTTSQRK
jgi:hypothetical protein